MTVNTCYTKVATVDSDHGNYMFHDVMRGTQHLYTIPLMSLYGSEMMLGDGRFQYFAREQREHVIPIRIASKSGQEFRATFTNYCNWVAEQVDAQWSFHIQVEQVGVMTSVFSFDNPTTAVLFKLVWV